MQNKMKGMLAERCVNELAAPEMEGDSMQRYKYTEIAMLPLATVVY